MSENEGLTGVATMPPGPVTDTTALERLLADCWHELQTDDEGMESYKLLNRMEHVTWTPPKLVFTIARHGGTVLGSTRAELQRWTVDIAKMTATHEKVGHHQLDPMQTRLDVRPLAKEVAGRIVARQDDHRLKWKEDGSVKVLVGKVLPAGSAVKQTLMGRRERFRAALKGRLADLGWRECGVNVFRPASG